MSRTYWKIITPATATRAATHAVARPPPHNRAASITTRGLCTFVRMLGSGHDYLPTDARCASDHDDHRTTRLPAPHLISVRQRVGPGML